MARPTQEPELRIVVGNVVGIAGGVDGNTGHAIVFDFVEIGKNFGRFGAEDDFLEVDLVEHFGKGSIFRLDTTTNR